MAIKYICTFYAHFLSHILDNFNTSAIARPDLQVLLNIMIFNHVR